MFKGLGNLGSLMKQAQQMGTKMQEINEELKSQRVTGSAGAGMVEVEADGTGDIMRVKIDRQLMEGGNAEMIEDLLPAAINQAVQKAKQLHAQALQNMTGGMNLPGLDEAISNITEANDDSSDPEA